MTEGEVETHHVYSRVAQQKHLCGVDLDTGIDYSYRRGMIRALLLLLGDLFAVDIANYSILSNHFHGLLRSRPDIVETWSDEQCAWNYKMLWPSWDGSQWNRTPTDQDIRSVLAAPETLARARVALGSISSFMARLKQPLSRVFNSEMKTAGHFWESRFGNRLLISDEDALCCSFYCDLNQVRAGMANSLIESNNSGIQDRILAEQARSEWIEKHSLDEWNLLLEDLEKGKAIGLDEETLREFYRDGWLAPISEDGPLATSEAIIIAEASGNPVELSKMVRLDSGLLLPNTYTLDSSVGELSTAEQNDDEAPGDSSEDKKQPAGKATQGVGKRGRPPRPRSYSIDRKYRKRVHKRKSDRCFINCSWKTYLSTVQRLADSIGRRPVPTPTPSSKVSTIGGQVKQFFAEVHDALQQILGSKSALALETNPGARSHSTGRGQVPHEHPPPPD
jgi:REP element-mobilizing transposase RayT